MIEFSGYINGVAEQYFHNKGRKLGNSILLIPLLLFLPGVVVTAIRMQFWQMIVGYCLIITIIPLLTLIPKSKKERLSITPKKIFTEDDCIICIADKYTESRIISDAKQLRDFGEFYEIVFRFGKISDKFICQKNLLSKGTLEEFEKLFSGKIVVP